MTEVNDRHGYADVSYSQLQQHFADQLTCIGDTDGDGNCPLALCGHCKPSNFTITQLAELVWRQRVEAIKEALVQHWLHCSSVTGSCIEDVIDQVEADRAR
jgi:hypothetical protein